MRACVSRNEEYSRGGGGVCGESGEGHSDIASDYSADRLFGGGITMSTRNAVPGFGPRLKTIREAKGLSRQALADAAGTHPDSVVKLEMGQRHPSLELAWRLATALGVPVADFLPPTGPKKKSGKTAD